MAGALASRLLEHQVVKHRAHAPVDWVRYFCKGRHLRPSPRRAAGAPALARSRGAPPPRHSGCGGFLLHDQDRRALAHDPQRQFGFFICAAASLVRLCYRPASRRGALAEGGSIPQDHRAGDHRRATSPRRADRRAGDPLYLRLLFTEVPVCGDDFAVVRPRPTMPT